MSKSALDQFWADAGFDVDRMKAALIELDDKFGGEVGDIPEGALRAWAAGFADPVKQVEALYRLGRAWEKEHAATLSKERQMERAPGARKNPLTGKIEVGSKA